MNASGLSVILEALARSTGMVPDPAAREAFAAAAKAAESMPKPVRVALVGDHPLADPWLTEMEWVRDAVERMRDELGAIENTSDDLLRNFRKFRNGERCQHCNRPAHPGNCTGVDPEGVTP